MNIGQLISPRERALVGAVVEAAKEANLIAQRDREMEANIERCPVCNAIAGKAHKVGLGLHAEQGHRLYFTCECGHKWIVELWSLQAA